MDFFPFSFVLNFVTVGCLWWATARAKTLRPFWRMLAAAWTLNWLGSIIWGVYELTTRQSLPTLTMLDSLYLGRYLLVGLALWLYPTMWTGRRAWEAAAVILLAGLVAWLSWFQPMLAATGRSWTYFLGVAIYPPLDAGLIYTAWIRYRGLANHPLRPVIVLLLLALISYGIANCINFNARMFSLEADPGIASLLWLLTDLLTGVAALYYLFKVRPSEK